MALTRKLLKSMGIDDEKSEQIIEAHTETVNGLKADINKYKADADKLPNIQKELDDFREAAKDGGWEKKARDWEAKYNNLVADNTAKATKAAKEAAVKAYYEGKNITGDNLKLAMRGSGAEIDAIELDGDKIKDTAKLDELVGGVFAGLVSKTQTKGANTQNPPHNNGGGTKTKEEIMNIRDAGERQKAIAENPGLFGIATE